MQDYTAKNLGFTLIEVMMALVIFSLGIIAVLTLQINSIKANSDADKIQKEIKVASDAAEYVLTLNFTDLNNNNSIDHEGYKVQWQELVNHQANSDSLKIIKVTVFKENKPVRTLEFAKKRF